MNKTVDYILEVAKCGGITKAANNLFITPSALSKFVQTKENELQVKLFSREGKKFTLTYAGERYVQMLKNLMEYQQQIDNEMGRIASMYMGRLRIGFQMSLAETVISRIIPEFKEEFPNIQIMLEEASSNELYQMLQANELDVILSLTDETNPNMNYVTIAEGNWVLAVALDNPLIGKAVEKANFPHPWIDMSECANEKIVLLGKSQPMRVYAEQVFETYGIKPEVNIMVKTTRTALLCVKNGLGVTISSELLIKHHHMENQISMLSFGENPVRKRMAVIYSPKSLLSEEILRLADICKKYINI